MENLQAIYPDNLIVVDCHLADEFENPDTVERSLLYGIWGLPTVQVDGKYAQIGAASCEEVQEIFQGFIEARLSETGGVSPVDITGGFTFNETSGTIWATFDLVDPVPQTGRIATLWIYDDDVYMCCGSGGEDTWNENARVIRSSPVDLDAVGAEVTLTENFDVGADWNLDNLHAVAAIQDTARPFTVIQAARIEQSLSFVLDLPGGGASVPGGNGDALLEARPNPFLDATHIAFQLSPRAASAPIDLRVIDAGGRVIRSLSPASVSPGRMEVAWDGRDDRGSSVPSGSYFLVLRGIDGEARAKLIRIK